MCDNKITYYVPKGFDYREHLVQCGRTDPFGGLALCEQHEHERLYILTKSDEPEDASYQDCDWFENTRDW